MKIWMVDDMPERAAMLRELIGVEVDLVPHAKAALRALVGGGVDADVWMLDHDMCISGDIGKLCPSTGSMICRCMDGCTFIRRVARYNGGRGLRWPPVVVVHSANTVRAPEMVRLLREYGVERVYRVPVGSWRMMVPTLRSILTDEADRWAPE